MSRSNFGFVLLAVLGLMMACGTAQAADGTWTNASGGVWSTASNWAGNVIADGVDSTADFSTLDLTTSLAVTLDSPRTLGHLVFGDTVPTNGWTLSGSTLTMDTTTGTPTIASTGWIDTIKVQLAGDDGLTQSGTTNWQLVDANYQTITGTITAAGGTFKLSRTGTWASRFFQGPGANFVVESGGILENYGSRNTFSYDAWMQPIPITLKGGVLRLTKGDLHLDVLTMNTSTCVVLTNNPDATYVGLAGGANWTVEASASGSSLYGTYPLTLVNGDGYAFNIDVADGTEAMDFRIISPIVEHASYPGQPVVKKGDGFLDLPGINAYTGDTKVEAGTLSISEAYLSDTADVYIDAGAIFNLGFIGPDTVTSLYLDGEAAAVGTWGALGSVADYNSSLITGTGLFNVLSGTWTPTPGDANGNGTIDEADAAILAANWLSTSATWSMGDFNDDDVVDGFDATLMATNWQGTSSAAVPEPGTLALLATGLIGLLAAWRKRK